MGQIYLIRHGQASFGSADYDELSALGREQARILGGWFGERGQRFQRVVSGDLKRHRQTAEAFLAALPPALREGLEWRIDPAFNEFNHHEVLLRHRPDPRLLENAGSAPAARAEAEFFRAAMARWMDGANDRDYGEPWPAFRSRCIDALLRLAGEAGPAQNIAVFTSGGTISVICQHLLGLPDTRLAELNWSLVNSAVTCLRYRPGQVSLSYLNNFAHLETQGRPEIITYR